MPICTPHCTRWSPLNQVPAPRPQNTTRCEQQRSERHQCHHHHQQQKLGRLSSSSSSSSSSTYFLIQKDPNIISGIYTLLLQSLAGHRGRGKVAIRNEGLRRRRRSRYSRRDERSLTYCIQIFLILMQCFSTLMPAE